MPGPFIKCPPFSGGWVPTKEDELEEGVGSVVGTATEGPTVVPDPATPVPTPGFKCSPNTDTTGELDKEEHEVFVKQSEPETTGEFVRKKAVGGTGEAGSQSD